MISDWGMVVPNYADIKWIVSNDDPDCFISEKIVSNVEVIVLQTDKNRGIHGARVRGIEKSTGDYIHIVVKY